MDIGISIIMMIRQLDWTFDKTVMVVGKNVGLLLALYPEKDKIIGAGAASLSKGYTA